MASTGIISPDKINNERPQGLADFHTTLGDGRDNCRHGNHPQAACRLLHRVAAGMARVVYVLQAAPNHYFPGHPECPERVMAIEAALQRVGIGGLAAEGQASLQSRRLGSRTVLRALSTSHLNTAGAALLDLRPAGRLPGTLSPGPTPGRHRLLTLCLHSTAASPACRSPAWKRCQPSCHPAC